MMHFWKILIVTCSICSFLHAYEWTDRETGRKLEAELQGLSKGNIEILRLSDRRKFTLPPDKVIRKDVLFALNQMSQMDGQIPKWNDEWSSLWWATYSEKEWSNEYDRMVKGLRSVWVDRSLRLKMNPSDFYNWVQHLRWILFYYSIPEYLRGKDEFIEVYKEIGQDVELCRQFLGALHPNDNKGQAFEVLRTLYTNYREDVQKYPRLAVAISIVFDQDFPRDWPHHQVSTLALPKPLSGPEEIFKYYVQAEKDQDLEYKLNDLSVGELKFMVDHRLPVSELTWAQKNVKDKISKFDKVFSSIRYDYSRLDTSQYDWPHENYNLASIKALGGICVDQAYFAAMAGKALGIPTLYFTGQGAGGGHAWFGYLRNEGKWETDCGRYENQNYPSGNALDPQTWTPITDSELKQLAEARGRDRQQFLVKQIIGWADLNTDQDYYREILQEAKRILPDNAEVWKYEAYYLDKKGTEEEKMEFYQSWISNFSRETDLKVFAQQKLIEIYQNAGEQDRVNKLRDEMLRDNRKSRFDVGIGVGAEILLEKVDAGKWDEADAEYKKLVRKFDAQGGGNLFYVLVRPYFKVCLDAGEKERAKDALNYVISKMDVESGSILDKEIQTLQNQL
jgi:hypothetical protein